MKKNKIILILIIMSLIVLLPKNIRDSNAEQENKIKIGCLDFDKFYYKDEFGTEKGYMSEYLYSIKKYSDLEFEVEKYNWKELLDKLEADELDMIMLGRRNIERLKVYDFSIEPIGVSGGVIYSKNEKEYSFGDSNKIDGKKIGISCPSLKSALDDYIEFNNYIYTPVIFNTSKECEDALKEGKIDFIAAEKMNVSQNANIIDYFNAQPLFAMSKKNSKKMDLFSLAQSELVKREPDILINLGSKYYSYTMPIFSNLEKEYLKENKEIKVGVFTDSNVYSKFDFKNQKFIGGIYLEIINFIKKESGLNIKIEPLNRKDFKNQEQVLKNQKCDLIIANEHNLKQIEGYLNSKPFMKNNFVVVRKNFKKKHNNKTLKIGIPKENEYLKRQVMELYPKSEILFDDLNRNIKNLNDEKIDLIVENQKELIYILQKPKYKNLQVIHNIFATEDSYFIGAKNTDPRVISIINKVTSAKSKTLKDIEEMTAIKMEYKLTTYDVIYNNILIIVLFAFIVFILIVMLFILGRKNRIIAKKSKEVEAAHKSKTDFLARMSHDMRTPMVTVIGFSDFGIEEKNNEKDVKYFKQIKQSAAYLLGLLNDILDMQKIEYQDINLNIKIESFKSCIKTVKNIASNIADKKNIKFELKENNNNVKYGKFDSMRLQQILINIISNAIKYTDAQGEVIWESTILEQRDKLIYINVIKDNGRGMSLEFQKKMFEPFSREIEELTNGVGGTGLGLSITKKLVEKMEGEIFVESKLGQGSIFMIKIPIEKVDEKELNEYKIKNFIKKNNINLKDKKVLICEDVLINAKILKKILKEKSMDVDYAKDGKEGVEKVKNEQYDIILMDIKMPVMDGLEASKEIRKFNKVVPIIALSANAYMEDIQKSLEAGMNAHLAKPIDKEKLFENIEKFI